MIAMRRLASITVCVFLAACVLLGVAARFYLPVSLPLAAALAIAAAVGCAAGGAAPRAVPAWIAGTILLTPAWGAFGFWAAASSLGAGAAPFLVYPSAATVGVVSGLVAWRWHPPRGRWRGAALAAGAGAVVAVFFLGGVLARWSAPAPARAPQFSLPLLGGGSLDSRSFAGKTVVLGFWASWCHPCRKELPHLQRLARRYSASPNVVFYLIDVGQGSETRSRGRAFLTRHHISLPSAFDAGGKVAARFPTHGMLPTRVVIGPSDRIRYRSFGYSPADDGFRRLRKAIASASRDAGARAVSVAGK